MLSREIHVDNAEVLKRMRALHPAVSGPMKKVALRAGGAVISNRAKELAPYRTGTLRRSIAVQDGETDDTVIIGTDVEYAVYQEFGTRYMAAQPFLRPAFDEKLAEAQTIIGRVLWQLIEAA